MRAGCVSPDVPSGRLTALISDGRSEECSIPGIVAELAWLAAGLVFLALGVRTRADR